jgi:hypothetical protein
VPAGTLTRRDTKGRTRAAVPVPPLPAPDDLEPKTATVRPPIPAHPGTHNSVSLSLSGNAPEITLRNNALTPP